MDFFVYMIVSFVFCVALTKLTKRQWTGSIAWLALLSLGMFQLLSVNVVTIGVILGLYILVAMLYRYRMSHREGEPPDPTPGNADEYEKLVEKNREKENK